MKVITVPYGKENMSAYVPEDVEIQYIDFKGTESSLDEEIMLKDAMDHPIGSPRLEKLVSSKDKVLIVVNDHTRPGPNKLIVQEILKRLKNSGLDKKQIKFIIATGSHRTTTINELINILGQDIVDNFEIIIHDCKDEENLIYLGESIYNVPIYVNKALGECTFCIVTGLIAPHHSAGFSGGRKSIVPGLVGLKTLKIHHSLPIRPYEPAMGFIYGNPFHEVALEVAKKVNVRFIVNAVQNPLKQNIAFVAGDLEEAHKKGVDICKRVSEVEIEERADIVITSPGGYPRDTNLYQAQKALSVAELIGKQDCVFILVAECRNGIGEGVFKDWLVEANTPEEVIERFKREGYEVGSNKAFMYARAMCKGKIIVVSQSLNCEELNDMMLGWAPNLQDAIEMAFKIKPPNIISILPNAVNIIPKIKKGDGENEK